jgi:hypothetical protein
VSVSSLPPSYEQPRQTSREAFERLRDSGALSSLRWAVYEALFHRGPMTRNELDAQLRSENAINASYSRRLTELERMGLIKRVSIRACRFTGRNCETWDVTDCPVPLPIDKPASKLELAREQVGDLVELCEGVAAWLEAKKPTPAAARGAVRIRERLLEITGQQSTTDDKGDP